MSVLDVSQKMIMKIVFFVAVTLLFSMNGSAVGADDPKIRINVMGSVIRPGTVYVKRTAPNAYDALQVVGGPQRLFNRRITLTRLNEDGELVHTLHRVPSPRESEEFAAALKRISIEESDMLFFHEGCR